MGETITNFKLLMEDLKSSWYFRIWVFLWMVCALFVLIVLGILGGRSEEASDEATQRIWIENANSIQFPSFRFHFEMHEEEYIEKIVCSHSGMTVLTTNCTGVSVMDQCIQIVTAGITAQNAQGTTLNDMRIQCNITSSIPSNISADDMSLSWEVLGDQAWGPDSYSPIKIAPNQNSWVLISKIVTSDGTAWDRRLMYHSTVQIPGQYYVSTVIDSFRVMHIESYDWFTGWMATGGVGGFAFFLLILHTIVMAVFGFKLTNDSRFLKGDATQVRYDNL